MNWLSLTHNGIGPEIALLAADDIGGDDSVNGRRRCPSERARLASQVRRNTQEQTLPRPLLKCLTDFDLERTDQCGELRQCRGSSSSTPAERIRRECQVYSMRLGCAFWRRRHGEEGEKASNGWVMPPLEAQRRPRSPHGAFNSEAMP